LRVTGPLQRGVATSLDAITAAVAAEMGKGTVAVLDERPGRAASEIHRRVLATLKDALYLVPTESGTARQSPDFECARTVLGLGVPLLDGWGTQGRVLHIWKERRFRVIQAEAELSHTAALADRWLAIRPGSEAALAAGLNAALAGSSPGEAAATTGLPPDLIAATARELRDHGPSLVVGTGPGVAELNERLGAPVVQRPAAPWESAAAVVTALDDVPAGSLHLLIIDGWSTPWDEIAPKLARGGIVVSLSPYHVGACERADWVVPAPAVFESLEDAVSPFDVKEAAWSVAPALKPPLPSAIEPAEFVARAAGRQDTVEAERRGRVSAIFRAKRGSVFAFESSATAPISEFESADKLWEKMAAGSTWIDEPATALSPRWSALADARTHAAAVTPLATKLYQESTLHRSGAGPWPAADSQPGPLGKES
jgi:hypothetical protein